MLSSSDIQAAFDQDGPLLAQYAREGEFDGRAYKDPETGISYPSVTTVLKLEDKSSLVNWAAMKVAERARDRVDIVLGDPDKVVDRLRYAHNDYRDERAWVGSQVHKSIEADMKGLWYSPDLDGEERAYIDAWQSFLSDYEIEPVLTEATVLVPCGAMGTLDGIWRMKDRNTGSEFTALIDVKSSKSVWPGHSVQLAALSRGSHWFEQVSEGTGGALLHKHPKLGKTWWIKHEGMPKFDRIYILHLRKDGYSLVPVVNVDQNYKIFECYVELWNAIKKLGEKEKEYSFG